MEWVLGITVILAAVVTLVIVDRMRKVRLRKRVRLEIRNAGNVKSRYELRAQDPEGALQFQFTLAGDSLPVHRTVTPSTAGKPAAEEAVAKASPAASARGVMDRAGRLIQLSGAVAGMLSMVGSLLPRSIGGPLQQKASQIRHVQAQASYAQQTPDRLAFQTSSVVRSVTRQGGDPPMRAGRRIQPEETERVSPMSPSPGDGFVWAQTPYVQPGDTLTVDLQIRSLLRSGSQGHTFQVISRTAEQDAPHPVSADGSVQIRAGFWARRILPYVVVGVIAAAMMIGLVVFGYWLVAAGVLA